MCITDSGNRAVHEQELWGLVLFSAMGRDFSGLVFTPPAPWLWLPVAAGVFFI